MENQEELTTKKTCALCGENEAEPESDYCEECTAKMKHYPFEKWQYLIPLMAVFFLVFSILFNTVNWSVFSGTAKAQKFVRNRQYYSALAKYDETNSAVVDAGGNYGINYLRNQLKIYDKLGITSYSDMNAFLGSHYSDNDMERFYNGYAKKEKDKLKAYSDAYEYFSVAANNDDSDSFEALIKNYDKEIKGKGLNEAFVNYYKYYACLVFEKDEKTQLKYVDKIAEQGKDYENLYLPLYTEIALNGKDYDKALSYCNQLEKLNAEDPYAFIYRTVAYRMQGNLVKASKACNDGLKINSLSSALNYQMAVICLLQDNLQLAEAYAETAHEQAATANNFVSAASIYSLIAQLRQAKYEAAGDKTHALNEKSIVDSINAELEEYGYSMSPDVAKIISGKKTVESVFAKGTGDFAW
ncbi:MAG: hypothetical protein MJ129_03675 [Clostridia bacterium]|nr:hypothetical protein [Clostridia bacterium]